MQLNEIITQYGDQFNEGYWQRQKCRWECVKCFRDHWQSDCPDSRFAEMLSGSLEKIGELAVLIGVDKIPFENIKRFAGKVPGEVRGLFALLFDEKEPLWDRIETFKTGMLSLFDRYEGEGSSSRYYFSETTVSIFLWLRCPDRYYIYKFWEAQTVAKELEFPYEFHIGADQENIENCYQMYDEIREAIGKYTPMTAFLQGRLDDACCPDPNYGILTTAAADFISGYHAKTGAHENLTEPFFASLTVHDWAKLLANKDIFPQDCIKILRQMKDHGSWTGYEELSEETGSVQEQSETGGYNKKMIVLSWRLIRKTGCPAGKNDSTGVLLTECRGDSGTAWKLRDNLAKALYTRKDFLSKVYMEEDAFDYLRNVLIKKKNIILQGAPGVGKTFTARRLAYSIMGIRDDDRIRFIQFHQSYSYEDFVMGYRPSEDGFVLQHGVFYQFCQKAAACPKQDFFFIIDEINRGEISKIFGELLMLIEGDYRGTEAVLAYDGRPFSVPENLYIIGMMNTADRSLAMIDYALRRRFSFFDIEPGFDTAGFQKYQSGLNNPRFNALINAIRELNKDIREDPSLGSGFCIGHSYFCGCKKPSDCTDKWMRSVVDYDILPMLREYWFEESERDMLDKWQRNLRGVLR